MSIHEEQYWKVYGFICRYVKIGGWVDGSKPIITLFEFRNPYGKMDRPLLDMFNIDILRHTVFIQVIHRMWAGKCPICFLPHWNKCRSKLYSFREKKIHGESLDFQSKGSTINHLGGVWCGFPRTEFFFGDPPNQIFIFILPKLTEEIFFFNNMVLQEKCKKKKSF